MFCWAHRAIDLGGWEAKFKRLDEAKTMNCDGARDSILLAAYGELPDEDAIRLERHLAECQECLDELEAMRSMTGVLALHPVVEPDPNLVAQSRMRLDEALDAIPQHGFLTRLRASAGAWFGHLQSAPALATLLVGVGFLSGTYVQQYRVTHAPRTGGVVTLTNRSGGGISAISEVKELPDNRVQVSYTRVVPEMAQGSLDEPYMRSLLMVGTKAAATNVVRMEVVAMLANECRVGHACRSEEDGAVRKVLLASLRTDRDPSVRMSALVGLQPYVSQDQQVRDAVSQTLLMDANSEVRRKAIATLEPVQGDASVRQALRTVSTMDENPYLRTVSMQALVGSSSIQ